MSICRNIILLQVYFYSVNGIVIYNGDELNIRTLAWLVVLNV